MVEIDLDKIDLEWIARLTAGRMHDYSFFLANTQFYELETN